MKKINFNLTMVTLAALLLLPGVSFAANQDVVINEIGAFEPPDYEWIEIYNRGNESVDLTGWKFYENDTNHGLTAFRGDMILEPSKYAIIANKADKFAERYASFTGTVIDSSWTGINESGEAVALKSSDGTVVESFTYLSAPDRSLERVNPSLADYTSANWQEHASGHTAGFQNSNYSVSGDSTQQNDQTNENPAPISSTGGQSLSTPSNQPPVAKAGSDVVVNIGTEITFDASASYDPEGLGLSYAWNFGNGATSKEVKTKHKYDYPGTYLVMLTVSDGSLSSLDQIRVVVYPLGIVINEFLPNPKGADEDNEWIELKNVSESTIDLSGWQISNKDEKTKPFIIPEHTFILSGGFLVFDGGVTGISFTNQSGAVKLFYPNSEIAEEVNYEIPAKEGYSAARKSDGSFVWTKNPTPGVNNVLMSDAIKTTSAARSEKIVREMSEAGKNVLVSSARVAVSDGGKRNVANFLTKTADAKTVSGFDEEFGQLSENKKALTEYQGSLAQASVFFETLTHPLQLFNLIALAVLTFLLVRLRKMNT